MCKEMSAEEMVWFVKSIYNKNFKNCKRFKEDLIMEGVTAIVRYQPEYKEELGSLSTYLGKCAYGTMYDYYKKQISYENACEELDGFADMLGYNDDYIDKTYLQSQLRELNRKLESNELCIKIIDDMISGMKQVTVSEKHGISKQYVFICWNDFRIKVRENYCYMDGELIKRSDLESGKGREL